MQKSTLVSFVSIVVAALACEEASDSGSSVGTAAQALAGDQARGAVPPGLPSRMLVGLFENLGGTWMQKSGVAWDVRYQYFTKGWVNNWGWGDYDGSWGLDYMHESETYRLVPAVQYYQLFGEPGGGEAQTLAKLQNASTMRGYYGDFKILMQRAKDFGKPVLVLVEADATGLLQQQTNNDPNAYAAVEDSGLAELASLPNTVSGWGLSFLQLRKAVGANNVVLGLHVSSWASGKDIAYFNVTDPLGPEVDKVHGFLSPLGLASNTTGGTYDVLVGDPLDRDSDFYRIEQGQDRWWDSSDSAPISSKSFNRYAEWLRLWNVKANKRWVLWQIPLGNSNSKNVFNDGGPAEGYKDNRPEYFFANGTAHLEKFANAGVLALLFGAGTDGQSNYGNDVYGDGQLFMKSRAGAFLNAGGLPIARGGGSGGSGSGGAGSGGASSGGAGSGGTSGSGGTGSSADPARYGFESGTQAWTSSGGMIRSVASSTTRAFAGARSLAVTIDGAAGTQRVRVSQPAAPRGGTVTFRVWIPSGSRITSIQPYLLQGSSGGWAWSGAWRSIASLSTNAWNTITVSVPSNAATPLHELGVEFTTNASYQGTAYVDSVTW